jgi:exodeoxyribonuclease V gamma subunit
VSELLDVAQRYLPDGIDARERLVLAHPLQPFSPQAFGAGDARRFSYRASWRQPLAGGMLQPAPPFAAGSLSWEAPEGDRSLSLRELQAFLRNPAKAFLRGRLDLSLPWRDDEREPDREPQGEDGLQRYNLVNALVDEALDDKALEARGLLPLGYEGANAAKDARERADRLREAIAAFVGDTPSSSIGEPVALPGWTLDVRLAGVHDGRRVVALAGSAKGKHRLRVWVEHLALAALLGERALTRRIWLEGKGSELKLREEDLPRLAQDVAVARLAELAMLWEKGHSRPLPFSPDAAFAWFDAQGKKEAGVGWNDAVAAFEGFEKHGDRYDPWFRLAFRPSGMLVAPGHPFAREFMTLAYQVFRGSNA